MTNIPDDIKNKLKAVIRRIEEAAAFDGVRNENFNDATSIKSLIRVSGMSERSLRNWFKIYTGESIGRYASKRRTDYAARIFRLFPGTSKSKVSELIGLNSSNALYPFMRKNGVNDMDELRTSDSISDFIPLNFRLECLSDCIMFYTQTDAKYEECSTDDFEAKNWDKIDSFIKNVIPRAIKIGDVGLAIDRYVENKMDEGIFISGILCKNISVSQLSCDYIGDIGWRHIPAQKYAVFVYKGEYEGLSAFYLSALQTLHQQKELEIDISMLIMEKYINSPVDTPAEELTTEIWIPIVS